MQNFVVRWKIYKIRRYVQKTISLETWWRDLKILLAINRGNPEEMYQRHKSIYGLSYLIEDFLLEFNPFKSKQGIKEDQLILAWFKCYGLKINTVSKEDIATLIEILKKISKKIPVPQN